MARLAPSARPLAAAMGSGPFRPGRDRRHRLRQRPFRAVRSPSGRPALSLRWRRRQPRIARGCPIDAARPPGHRAHPARLRDRSVERSAAAGQARGRKLARRVGRPSSCSRPSSTHRAASGARSLPAARRRAGRLFLAVWRRRAAKPARSIRHRDRGSTRCGCFRARAR